MSRTRTLMEEELIRVAIQCFNERGYQNTTLDDIVSQVNISRVTFYTYFKSKEALLKTIFERAITTYHQGLEEIFAQPLSCREKLRQAALFQIMTATNDVLPLARIFFREEANLPSDTAALVEASQRRRDRLLEQVIEEGIRSGEVINEHPRLLTQAFVGMCSWLYHWYQPGEQVSPEDIVRVFTRVLETGVFTAKTHTDNGTVVHSLRQVEHSLQEVRQEFKKVAQQLRGRPHRSGASSRRL